MYLGKQQKREIAWAEEKNRHKFSKPTKMNRGLGRCQYSTPTTVQQFPACHMTPLT